MPPLRMGADGQCIVEFRLSATVGPAQAWVVGDFNDWSSTETPMRRERDGAFTATVALALGRSYRFRYYLGNGEWENDWAADDYVPNEYGGSDSVINTPQRCPSNGPTSDEADAAASQTRAGGRQ